MVFAKSLDESLFMWRGTNANYANETKFAKIKRKFAAFAFFATFALSVPDFAKAMSTGGQQGWNGYIVCYNLFIKIVQLNCI